MFSGMVTKQGGVDAETGALRKKWFRQMLGVFTPGRMVDLGAGHGAFSVIAADAGWQVTAVDARGDRYPDDGRIEWVVEDVRKTSIQGYDVVSCLGLFYHLTIDDQIGLLERCAGLPMILDTHVANDRRSPFTLSDEVVLRGYRGKLFKEELEASTASWENEHSFWPRPREMYRMFDDHGYDMMAAVPWYMPTRTFWLCLPREPRSS
jgi:hypothetical protein